MKMKMSPKVRTRSTWAAVVLAILVGLSQVPWDQVLDLAGQVLGAPPSPQSEGS